MQIAFWKKKDTSNLETLSWNLMVTATNPDQCWKIASLFRDTGMPGNVCTCETSFLMGSIVRDIIRNTVPSYYQQKCIKSAESAYYKTFDDQSTEPLPSEMIEIYGTTSLSHLARTTLADYGEEDDLLISTSAIFVQRLEGDARMKYEVIPLFEERAKYLSNLFAKAIK